jgi:hypothetical protein
LTTGHITPSEATEIAKVIDAYVRAHRTAELDDRVARVVQLSDGELMRISKGRQPEDVQCMSKLLMLTCDK